MAATPAAAAAPEGLPAPAASEDSSSSSSVSEAVAVSSTATASVDAGEAPGAAQGAQGAAAVAVGPSSSGPAALKAGTLSKRGKVNKGLKKRWFELMKDGSLRYYVKQNGEQRGTIQLSKVSKHEHKADTVVIVLRDLDGRKWELHADTVLDAIAWHTAIVSWMGEHNPSSVAVYQATKKDPFYDLTVSISSMEDLRAHGPGWKLEFGGSNSITNVMHAMKNVNHTVVTVDGLFNRGKTHLLSGISGIPLPSEGVTRHTEGLCFKTSSSDATQANILFVDAAGSRMPVPCGMLADDRKAIDHFLRIAKLRLAHCVLLVVNHLTFDDQEYIREMVKIIPQNTLLLIVHNLHDISHRDDLLRCIHTDVVMGFGGSFAHKTVNGYVTPYWTPFYNREPPIMHFVLAKDGTDAGKIVNRATYEMLKVTLQGVRKTVNICEQFESISNEILDNYINRERRGGRLRWDWNTNSVHFDDPETAFELRKIHVYQFALQQSLFIQHMVVVHPKYAFVLPGSAEGDDAIMADWVEIRVSAPNLNNASVALEDNARVVVKGEIPPYASDDPDKYVMFGDLGCGKIHYPIQLSFDLNPSPITSLVPGRFDAQEGLIWTYDKGFLVIWVPKATSVMKKVPPPPKKAIVDKKEGASSGAAGDILKDVPVICGLPARCGKKGVAAALQAAEGDKWLTQFWVMAKFFKVDW
eukprot:m51a1_g7386 hypothetical protein (695) ;mRNA; r:117959-120677